jgi:hypothetical protein
VEACGSWGDVQQLLSHWAQLPDERKVQFAQMAVLTRWVGFDTTARTHACRPCATPEARAALTARVLSASSVLHCRQFMLAAAAPVQQPASQHQQQEAADSAVPAGAHQEVPDVRAIAQLLARFSCNNHTICDDELRPLGVGLYPLGALINHACAPNCAQSFRGPVIVFRCVSACMQPVCALVLSRNPVAGGRVIATAQGHQLVTHTHTHTHFVAGRVAVHTTGRCRPSRRGSS